ncbi:MAG: sugar ABC transporter permease [Methanomassiliicoccales archaeon]|nr:sugar ABC transporter permease [Methanomassiliicoccales archaeon]
MKMKRITSKAREQIALIAFLLPSLLILLVMGGFPFVYSLYLSLTQTVLSKPPPYPFIGLQNYWALFQDKVFVNSLWKTAYFSSLMVIGILMFGLSIALLLNCPFRGKSAILALLLLPWAVPKVVNGLIWKWILDGNYGIFNAILQKLGIISEYKFWFMESPLLGLAMFAVVSIWKESSFVAVVILAALQTVPKELYEAAAIDGANWLGRFWHVTIPNIRSALLIVLILSTSWAVKTFDLVAVLTGGGPGDQTMLTYYYAYLLSFDYLDYGKGAAAAYVVSFILCIMAVLYYKLLKGAKE